MNINKNITQTAAQYEFDHPASEHCRKKTCIPLLKDHHNHLSFYALLHGCLNLGDVKQKSDAIQKIMNSGSDSGSVSVILGWNNGYYDFTEDELSHFPPVIIVNLSLHRFVMSLSAEKILEEKYPEVVKNYRDPVWYENHFPGLLVFLANMIPPTSEMLDRFFYFAGQKGIFYMEDMLLPNQDVLSVILNSPYSKRTSFWANLSTFRSLKPQYTSAIKGIKLFTDGALGARTAAINHPYTDGTRGLLLMSDDSLCKAMLDIAAIQKAISIHAIGELATSQVVRVIRKLKNNGVHFSQIRMEHCQFIDEASAAEAKSLGIILSMQPNFSMDSIDYKDRLLPWYIENNNPFRMLIDKFGFVPGKDLIFGSDGMPHGVEAAINASLFPPYSIQKLTLDEFIAGYCIDDTHLKHGHIELNFHESSVSCAVTYIP